MPVQKRTLTKTLTIQKSEWRDYASCKGMDTELFFPNLRGMNTQKYIEMHLPCGQCPVAQECREDADKNGEVDGVWGGSYRYPRMMRNKAIDG